jgi:hypothetical protein
VKSPQKKKPFFFEKKNQKTSVVSPWRCNARAPDDKSFFASFFPKKEVLA